MLVKAAREEGQIMTIEQIKETAKKRLGKDLTDEQAQALLENYGGALTDEDLEKVAGGFVF